MPRLRAKRRGRVERLAVVQEPQRKAAAAYFTECIGEAKRLLVADVGWSGQILLLPITWV